MECGLSVSDVLSSSLLGDALASFCMLILREVCQDDDTVPSIANWCKLYTTCEEGSRQVPSAKTSRCCIPPLSKCRAGYSVEMAFQQGRLLAVGLRTQTVFRPESAVTQATCRSAVEGALAPRYVRGWIDATQIHLTRRYQTAGAFPMTTGTRIVLFHPSQ